MGAKYLIGIDEAGRGALAGPVAVGLVAWEIKDWFKLKKFLQDYPIGKDSKKLTVKQRDFWFAKIKELAVRGWILHTVVLVGNKMIDKKGINWAINLGLKRCLTTIQGLPLESQLLLDGGLRAPSEWVNQKTIIKGDEKELIIGLASIVAKVSRDREMLKLDKKYPNHYFSQHKGYGTRLHYQKINEFDLTLIHRQTYLP